MQRLVQYSWEYGLDWTCIFCFTFFGLRCMFFWRANSVYGDPFFYKFYGWESFPPLRSSAGKTALFPDFWTAGFLAAIKTGRASPGSTWSWTCGLAFPKKNGDTGWGAGLVRSGCFQTV